MSDCLCHECFAYDTVEFSLEQPGSRIQKPDDGCPEFMAISGNASRMEGSMPVKPGSGWDSVDDAACLKLLMSREEIVSCFFLLFLSVVTYILTPSYSTAIKQMK